MPIQFRRSWHNAGLEPHRSTVVHFFKERMAPDDETVRHRCQVDLRAL